MNFTGRREGGFHLFDLVQLEAAGEQDSAGTQDAEEVWGQGDDRFRADVRHHDIYYSGRDSIDRADEAHAGDLNRDWIRIARISPLCPEEGRGAGEDA